VKVAYHKSLGSGAQPPNEEAGSATAQILLTKKRDYGAKMSPEERRSKWRQATARYSATKKAVAEGLEATARGRTKMSPEERKAEAREVNTRYWAKLKDA
jgi:hypothetical protein